jgi:hypothetical protein
MTVGADKVRENLVRRMADRQGLRLVKSRRRDERALDYGGWGLLDQDTGSAVYGTEIAGRFPTGTLEGCEEYLRGERSATRASRR